ncbi:MAG: isoprenyl transferase [Sumerlaeia bacterium]
MKNSESLTQPKSPHSCSSATPLLLEPVSPEEQALFRSFDLKKLPKHVAIIMDGNGRWAKMRSMRERIEGHRAGIDSVREAVRTSAQLRMKALTLYAFSSENWKRPKHEVAALMNLLESFLVKEIPELMENNIRLVSSGDIGRLPQSAQKKLAETTRLTANNTGTILNLALSYGGRQEIVDACKSIAAKVQRGELHPDEIDDAVFNDNLYQPDLGEPELLIRTSGEQRISNFLLWQIAYTEFVYLPVLWPDFRRIHFLEAVNQYLARNRRFGGI